VRGQISDLSILRGTKWSAQGGDLKFPKGNFTLLPTGRGDSKETYKNYKITHKNYKTTQQQYDKKIKK
jgi:hypothetical protein